MEQVAIHLGLFSLKINKKKILQKKKKNKQFQIKQANELYKSIATKTLWKLKNTREL